MFQPTILTKGCKRFSLTVKEQKPCSTLSHVIHSYLQVDAQQPTPYPILPDGTQAFFISPDRTIIGGAQKTITSLYLPKTGQYFGVRFYPAAWRHFFDANLSEIANAFVDSSFLSTYGLEYLSEKIYQQNKFQLRVGACEQWLLKHFNPYSLPWFDFSINRILQTHGNINITLLANKTGISPRQLNRTFQLHIGLSAKEFSRIIRIQSACQQLYGASKSAVNIAYDLGFYDQAHFVRDFKQVYKDTPCRFFEHF